MSCCTAEETIGPKRIYNMLTALINRYLAYVQQLSLQGINQVVQ